MSTPEFKTTLPCPLVISEAEILPVKPHGGLVAFASCVINGQLYLGNIAVHTRPDGSGYRLVFPVKVLPNGKQIHCFHPVNKEAAEALHRAIIQKFELLSASVQSGENVASTSKKCGGFYDNGTGIS